MDLKDEQWNIIEHFIPKRKVRKDGKGRPPQNPRVILNGILWILRTGAQWKYLPKKYGSYQTCHRYFQSWNRSGVMKRILKAIAKDLKERGKIDVRECFIDGTFSGAKKGGLELGKLNVGRGLK